MDDLSPFMSWWEEGRVESPYPPHPAWSMAGSVNHNHLLPLTLVPWRHVLIRELRSHVTNKASTTYKAQFWRDAYPAWGRLLLLVSDLSRRWDGPAIPERLKVHMALSPGSNSGWQQDPTYMSLLLCGWPRGFTLWFKGLNSPQSCLSIVFISTLKKKSLTPKGILPQCLSWTLNLKFFL